jgi:hypothetical protein
LTYLLVAAGAILFVGLAAWILSRPCRIEGTYVFRYHFAFQALAYVCAFVVPAGLTILNRFYRFRGDDAWYLGGAYVIFGGLGLFVFWEVTRFYVRLTPAGVEGRSAWRPRKILTWDEVSELRYSSFNSWFVFFTEDGQRIRVPALIGRLTEFLRLIESRLLPESLVRARTGYDRAGRAMPRLGNEPILEARPPRR